MSLKQRFTSGEMSYGAWTGFADPQVAQIMGRAGFDFICVDLQHSFVSMAQLSPLLDALHKAGSPAVVRVPWNTPDLIMRSLDLGAEAIIVPLVNNAEEARSAANACRYAPAGNRSWGPIWRNVRAIGIKNRNLASLVGPAEVIIALAGMATHTVFSAPAALLVAGADTVAAATRDLTRRFEGFVAVTDGAQGCFWIEDGKLQHLLPPVVDVVDTLAAGDVFHGAFTLALAEGRSIRDAVAFANTAAALKCTVFGGRRGSPDRRAVMRSLAHGISVLVTD
jgi:2-keto-3-deoxy-L-rhamnonate aldolase RhmA